jgi:wyosine [tRNA(Phe)-imidazoG37] synthetase (radical SAM superfamily)
MQYLYGPVDSRRLGLSLGITLTPHKACSLDCVYCQLGGTTLKTVERKSYLDIKAVISEFKEYLKSPDFKSRPPAYISLSGFGEPTLHIGIAVLISEVKKLTPIPLVLISNGSLFSDASVRRDVMAADLLIPSLDAVTQDVFERVDRPAPEIKIEDVIEGLAALRKEFKGRLFLEIMLVRDINDSADYARKFKQAIDRINPDKIQLNVPVRTTAEPWVKAPDKERVLEIKKILGMKCEII